MCRLVNQCAFSGAKDTSSEWTSTASGKYCFTTLERDGLKREELGGGRRNELESVGIGTIRRITPTRYNLISLPSVF